MTAVVKGFDFPLRFGPRGHLERATGAAKHVANLKNIFSTELEERIMAPQFGHLGFSQLLRNIDIITRSIARNSFEEAAAIHEPRVQVTQTDIDATTVPGQASVTLTFRVRNSQEFTDLSQLVDG